MKGIREAVWPRSGGVGAQRKRGVLAGGGAHRGGSVRREKGSGSGAKRALRGGSNQAWNVGDFAGDRREFEGKSCMKRELNQKLSGNEVYYTSCLVLQVKNMLCRERDLY